MRPDVDLTIPTLGPRTVPSPLGLSEQEGDGIADYVPDEARVLHDPAGRWPEVSFERAGPRSRIRFEPSGVHAGIVTCGGLCPGMNNVVRGVVMGLWHAYGVRRITGFQYGYLGFRPDAVDRPLDLVPDLVRDVHHQGGTFLGSSRGPQSPAMMVDTLVDRGINILFCVGGDGTLRGAHAIWREVEARGLPIAVVGIPKTIDNDVLFIERTFGFDTAVALATQAIEAAHVEARGAPRGLGLVRLMGRNSGFIAASATLASGEVNLCLVPEQPFDLQGPCGILPYLRERLLRRGHAVVVVAEGAGQEYAATSGTDASGNRKLGDIGLVLKDLFARELADVDASLKYIDPSYIIRAAPANAGDAIYCGELAEAAVHAALAGKTGLVVGRWSEVFTHVPLDAVIGGRKVLPLDGTLWRNVVASTGQPLVLRAPRSGL